MWQRQWRTVVIVRDSHPHHDVTVRSESSFPQDYIVTVRRCHLMVFDFIVTWVIHSVRDRKRSRTVTVTERWDPFPVMIMILSIPVIDNLVKNRLLLSDSVSLAIFLMRWADVVKSSLSTKVLCLGYNVRSTAVLSWYCPQRTADGDVSEMQDNCDRDIHCRQWDCALDKIRNWLHQNYRNCIKHTLLSKQTMDGDRCTSVGAHNLTDTSWWIFITFAPIDFAVLDYAASLFTYV